MASARSLHTFEHSKRWIEIHVQRKYWWWTWRGPICNQIHQKPKHKAKTENNSKQSKNQTTKNTAGRGIATSNIFSVQRLQGFRQVVQHVWEHVAMELIISKACAGRSCRVAAKVTGGGPIHSPICCHDHSGHNQKQKTTKTHTKHKQKTPQPNKQKQTQNQGDCNQ